LTQATGNVAAVTGTVLLLETHPGMASEPLADTVSEFLRSVPPVRKRVPTSPSEDNDKPDGNDPSDT